MNGRGGSGEEEGTVSASIPSRYLDGTYMEAVRDWHASDAPWKAGKILSMLDAHGIAPETICDVGCGAGEVVAELQRRMGPNVEFRGYDVSPQAIAICRPKENPKLKYILGNFLDAQSAPCDLLLLLDVIEHVPDYIGFLETLREKSSLFLFHIPLDISVQSVSRRSMLLMDMRREYGHLHYFTRETALSTLSEAGYDVIDVRYTDDLEIRKLKGMRQAAGRWVRNMAFRASPEFSAFLFSAYNLLVLAKPAGHER